MRRVVLICPSRRDVVAVRAAGLDRRYDVRFAGPDLDALTQLDAEALAAAIGEEVASADAVVATKDRSALLASVVAARAGLPGPSPSAVASTQHKPTARALQAEAVPAATPRWQVLDGRVPPFGPPWFVKPVVGRLSQGARRVDDPRHLDSGGDDAYATAWGALARLGGVSLDARGAIAEELLDGAPVTVEGYVHGGRTTILGVTDSVMYPGTLSFERFEYPTRLAPERAAAAADVAARLPAAFGFDGGFFNVELFVPERGTPGVIELNGRIASQFAPLYAAVHGRSSYDALVALALGEDPKWRPERTTGAALSYVVRRFEDAWVEAVPAEADDVEILVGPGANLSAAAANDEESFRLAIVYASGATHEEAHERAKARAAQLRFRLSPPRAA